MKLVFAYKENGELINAVKIMVNEGNVVAIEDINGIIEFKRDFDMEIHE